MFAVKYRGQTETQKKYMRKTKMQETQEIKTVYIEQQNTHAEKTLKSVLSDIEKTNAFLSDGLINFKGTSFKVESEKINNMFDLSKRLKSEVVKYAYGKRIKNTATRELNTFIKEQTTEQ